MASWSPESRRGKAAAAATRKSLEACWKKDIDWTLYPRIIHQVILSFLYFEGGTNMYVFDVARVLAHVLPIVYWHIYLQRWSCLQYV